MMGGKAAWLGVSLLLLCAYRARHMRNEKRTIESMHCSLCRDRETPVCWEVCALILVDGRATLTRNNALILEKSKYNVRTATDVVAV